MIYVNEKQLLQVEYLIEQSSRGYHVLFDVEVIRRVFADTFAEPKGAQKNKRTSDKKSDDDANSPEKHIENLILQPTLVSKRAYLENLSPQVLKQVLRTYFSIVENNIVQTNKYTQ